MSRPPLAITIVLDCGDATRLAEFWTAALGYTPGHPIEQFVVLRPATAGDTRSHLILQQVAEPKAGKNRMHLDLHAADLDAEMARLIALGARKLQDAPNCLGTYCWFLMADPEGNEFCLAPSG
jgi:predicted enzyme related to lactoylglutathione lyase